MSDFELFKRELLKNNTDGVRKTFQKKFMNLIVDKTGDRLPIHIACSIGNADILNILLENGCDIDSNNKNGLRPIHYACTEGHANIVRILLKSQCNIECEDRFKLRPIHLACSNGFLEIFLLLLSRNCEIECEDDNRWRPIHHGCAKGHIDIVKILVKQSCQVECTSNNGETPYALAKLNNHNNCLEYICKTLYCKKIFTYIKENNTKKFINLYKSYTLVVRQVDTGLSVLEIALRDNADEIIQSIMDKPVTDAEVRYLMNSLEKITRAEMVYLIKECLLYRSIIHNHSEDFKAFISGETINRSVKLLQSSFLEIAVHYSSYAFVGDILKKMIFEKNIWDKAKRSATITNQIKILDEIVKRESLLQLRNQSNFTILHTAVCDNDADMVEYILSNHTNMVDVNSNNLKVGTALALAHILHYKSCIDVLEQYKVDSNTQNQYLETPLHEAIRSGMRENCQYLIDQSQDIDKFNNMGLTSLHLAVIRGFEDVCEKLITKGADCIRYIKHSTDPSLSQIEIPNINTFLPLTSMENALTLCLKIHKTIFPCFINILDEDKANICDGENNSLLHLAVKCLQPNTCRSLLNSGAMVNKFNNNSNSALLEVLSNTDEQLIENKDLDSLMLVVKILIEFGVDLNKTTIFGESIFKLAFRFHNERLMINLYSTISELSTFNEDDFVQVFTNNWFDFAEVLLNHLTDNFLSENISTEIIQLVIDQNRLQLLLLLFNKANSNIQQSVLEELIYHSAQLDDENLFDCLINKTFFFPKLFENGETLVTNLMKTNKMHFCVKLLKSDISEQYINFKNKDLQTPLQIAINLDLMDLIDELINRTEDFNYEDAEGRTPLTQLLEKISICEEELHETRLMSLIKSIIQKGGNIYKSTSLYQNVIDACNQSSKKATIERIYCCG